MRLPIPPPEGLSGEPVALATEEKTTGTLAAPAPADPNWDPHDNWGPWTYENEDSHSSECQTAGCTAAASDSHSFDTSGVCTVCGYTKTPGVFPHTHYNWDEWRYKNRDFHSRECLEADCDVTDSEPHSFGADGICSGCKNGKRGMLGIGDHSPHGNWSPWTYENSKFHSRKCLAVPDCTATQGEPHSFDADGMCTGCGRDSDGRFIIGIGDKNDSDNDPDNKNPSFGFIGVGDLIEEPDLETDISSPSLPDDIQALPDSSLIGIRYSISVSVTLQKDIFSIIQGTNKTIFLSDGRLQWAFYGKDILYPKAINLQVDISLLVNTTSSNKRPISNLVGNTPTSVLSFANNGQLPGKATITVSKETLFPNSSYTSFWVYHYDSTRNRLESIARNLRPTSDGYLNFDIWHNSDYIITTRELTNLGSGSSYKGPIDEHTAGSGTSSSTKDNPHTGA